MPSRSMAAEDTLSLTTRAPEGSRAARRLRREGLVPGVIYGGDGGPEHFAVDGRILRNTLAHAGAILEISLDGATSTPVLVKDVQRHPVRGEAVHVDLLRVRMDEVVQTTVALHLHGAEEAPGVTEGGILSHELREVNVEALPGDIPEEIVQDVSGMEMNATLTRTTGVGRVAWRAGTGLPVVQCVRARREGPLTGGSVELLSISPPIPGQSACR